jgi:tRNA uridine 5-carbamoylmethylation protein Kti12
MLMSWLIIVTGRPAAGKSTLAKWLGQRLDMPVLSKDGIKEILFEELGWHDREWSKRLGRASLAQDRALRLDLDGDWLEVDTTDFSAVHYEAILGQIESITSN